MSYLSAIQNYIIIWKALHRTTTNQCCRFHQRMTRYGINQNIYQETETASQMPLSSAELHSRQLSPGYVSGAIAQCKQTGMIFFLFLDFNARSIFALLDIITLKKAKSYVS